MLESPRERLYKSVLAFCKKQKKRIRLDSKVARRLFIKAIVDVTTTVDSGSDRYWTYVEAVKVAVEGMAKAYSMKPLRDKTISKAFSDEFSRRIMDYYDKKNKEEK